MKRLILALILVVLFFGIGRTENETISNETQAIYDTIEKSSVQIFGTGQEDGLCTGTIISNDKNAIILTCKHCIGMSEEIWADNLKAKFIILSTIDDLAYMIMNGIYSDKISAKIANYKEPIGNSVYFYGRPGLITNYPSNGNIIKYTNEWGWIKMPLILGCSGSGIFNKNKELIGVLWGYRQEGIDSKLPKNFKGGNITIFEPLYDVKRFLEEIEQIIK